MLRILTAQGWYIVCYAHAIYLLNLLLAFLQPKFDPSLQEDLLADEIEEGGDVPSPLPSQRDDEFQPFVRCLPEWQFWLSSTRATAVALLCTFSEVFNVPVSMLSDDRLLEMEFSSILYARFQQTYTNFIATTNFLFH